MKTFLPLTVTHAPVGNDNPYNRLIAEALERYGIRVELIPTPEGRSFSSQLGWTFGRPLIHWHWINSFYQGRTLPRFIARLAIFSAVLLILRCTGTKLVHTVHNLIPHDCHYKPLHLLANRLIGLLMHRLLVHSPEAAQVVARNFGARHKIRCIRHIDYGDANLPRPHRRDARQTLGLSPEVRLAVWFGQLRPYKGVERLIAAAGALGERGFQLMIVGRPASDEYRQIIESLAAPHPNVILRLHRVSDDELATLLSAADVAVFAYAESLTSGAAHMALAFERPIACPPTTAFAELIRLRLAVPIRDTADVAAIADDIAQAASLPSEEFLAACRAYRQECSLTHVGQQLRDLYYELVAHKPVTSPRRRHLTSQGQEGQPRPSKSAAESAAV